MSALKLYQILDGISFANAMQSVVIVAVVRAISVVFGWYQTIASAKTPFTFYDGISHFVIRYDNNVCKLLRVQCSGNSFNKRNRYNSLQNWNLAMVFSTDYLNCLRHIQMTNESTDIHINIFAYAKQIAFDICSNRYLCWMSSFRFIMPKKSTQTMIAPRARVW